MSNYGDIKAEVADWLARSDLTAKIPRFVRSAERAHWLGMYNSAGQQVAPPIRVDDQERHATIEGNDTRKLPLPNDVNATGVALEFHRIWKQGNPTVPLTQVSRQQLATHLQASSGPEFYCRLRNELEFNFVVGVGEFIEFTYYEKYDPLVDDTDTNWLTDNVDDVYIYGALAHAEPYLRNDARVGTWVSMYADAAHGLAAQDARMQVSQGQMLRTRVVAVR